jgi:hypothetical protein
MEPPQQLYNQSATHFALPIFIRPDAEIDGQLVIELADRFLADLLFPGVRLTSLDTKRAGEGSKLNSGEFSERRWTTTVRKLRRFLELDAALKPAFLSREPASEVMQRMLGYFYRERS